MTFSKRWLLPLCLLVVVAGGVVCVLWPRASVLALGAWAWVGAMPQPPVGDGAAVLNGDLRCGGRVVHLVAMRFSPARTRLVVLDNGGDRLAPRFRNLADAMEKTGCIGGTNGGFFDWKFQPSGQVIADGVAAGMFDPQHWGRVVLAVRSRGFELVETRSFLPAADVQQLLQPGPWLVHEGKALRSFGDEDQAVRRTFLAVDADGNGLLGCVFDVRLIELADLLASDALRPWFRPVSAANLDGGESSGAWFRMTGSPPIHLPERDTVRTYVGVMELANGR